MKARKGKRQVGAEPVAEPDREQVGEFKRCSQSASFAPVFPASQPGCSARWRRIKSYVFPDMPKNDSQIGVEPELRTPIPERNRASYCFIRRRVGPTHLKSLRAM